VGYLKAGNALFDEVQTKVTQEAQTRTAVEYAVLQREIAARFQQTSRCARAQETAPDHGLRRDFQRVFS
jgi:primosomal protein N''